MNAPLTQNTIRALDQALERDTPQHESIIYALEAICHELAELRRAYEEMPERIMGGDY